jgi:nicotinamide-nucleotide amidase
VVKVQCELIVVGDELLAGRVVDTNSAELARRLAEIGIRVSRVIRVGDDSDSIRQALAESLVRSRLIFIIGGLGPTSDDQTTAAVAGLLNRQLVLDKKTRYRIQQLFQKRGVPMPKLAERQALVPKGAQLFENPAGMVPGMVINHQGSVIILLPGVPQELKALLAGAVIGYLKERFSTTALHNELIRTAGLIESRIAPKIEKIVKNFPDVQVGYYPSVAGLDLMLSGPDVRGLKMCADRIVRLLGENVVTREEKNLAQVVGELLRRQKLTVATAESCTGGLVGDIITSVAGSSDYYLGGIIAYANELKRNLLGVSAKTLKKYGAVSRQTVAEMLNGVAAATGADCAIAISGIAGPGGGTKTKPVGLVFIGVAAGNRVRIQKHLFTGAREIIKQRAAWTALNQLRILLGSVKNARTP